MRTTLLILSILICISSFAAHIIGGEMRYTYIGPGSQPNSKIYKITMILFKGDDPQGAPLAGFYIIAIYNNDTGQKFPGTTGSTGNNWLITKEIPPGDLSVPIVFPLCIQNAPVLNYTYAIYSMTVELPDNLNGYTVTYQTCCRINGMINVGNNAGSTYNCVIPGTNQLGSGNDSSPQFGLPVNVICNNAPFTLNFGATDPNGDSLVYSLCNAYNGGLAVNAGFDDPAPPPYQSVLYNTTYSGVNPLGTSVSINSQTGVITGIAPGFGKYVVCVCINVYRNGVLIATHRKDLIVQVSACTLTIANPMPSFVTCDGFTVQFSHTSTGANTVFWDFGDQTTLVDTSNLDNPVYTYPDTGVYTVKLVINRGTGCTDSVYRTVGVFPGFFPDFTSSGICVNNPTQFTDLTTTTYGLVNKWRWDFGDVTTLADTSQLQNPGWTYTTTGTKNVRFIVSNSKGCIDTVFKSIDIIDKPIISMGFRDTLLCVGDAVQMQASGSGVWNWTPLVSISNPNIATPTVNPASTTTYYVQLNDNGCINNDSVRIRIISAVTLAAIADTTICAGDQIQLSANTDGLQFLWTPSSQVNNPNILNPIATTPNTTTYQIVATVGSCSATDFVTVTTVPYPGSNAGPDTTICYNTAAQLNGAIVGSSYTWTPAAYLTNSTILNPLAYPPRTTAFVLTVYDTIGCPKPGIDTVIVNVIPKLNPFAGRDTSVIVGQPLQFNASGGTSYSWSPPTGLNNPNIADPVGVYVSEIDSIRYRVLVREGNCVDSAFVTVRVYKTPPYIFVPTAFTPNGDGLNDVVRPIAVGIKRINYFRIYNRWGQMVFSTTINGHGWDGKIGGRDQGTNTFVWIVSAVDYQDRPVFQKGTVTLIR
jgi:gliding motility-associated-like protein